MLLVVAVGCERGRIHCGVKVPRGSRAVGRLVEYPFMEVDFLGSSTTSMDVDESFHVCCCEVSWNLLFTSVEVNGSKSNSHGSFFNYMKVDAKPNSAGDREGGGGTERSTATHSASKPIIIDGAGADASAQAHW